VHATVRLREIAKRYGRSLAGAIIGPRLHRPGSVKAKYSVIGEALCGAAINTAPTSFPVAFSYALSMAPRDARESS